MVDDEVYYIESVLSTANLLQNYPPIPTKEGYVFIYWSEDGVTQANIDIHSSSVTKTVTYYALFEEILSSVDIISSDVDYGTVNASAYGFNVVMDEGYIISTLDINFSCNAVGYNKNWRISYSESSGLSITSNRFIYIKYYGFNSQGQFVIGVTFSMRDSSFIINSIPNVVISSIS